MKQIILFLLCMNSLSILVNGQNKSDSVSLGFPQSISLGPSIHAFGVGSGVGVTLKMQFGFAKYVSVGPLLEIAGKSYPQESIFDYTTFDYNDFEVSGLKISFGVRGEVHPYNYTLSHFDPYISVVGGYALEHYSYKQISGPTSSYTGNPSFNRPFIGGYGGFNYFVNNKVSLFFEGGFGTIGLLSIGLTFKIN